MAWTHINHYSYYKNVSAEQMCVPKKIYSNHLPQGSTRKETPMWTHVSILIMWWAFTKLLVGLAHHILYHDIFTANTSCSLLQTYHQWKSTAYDSVQIPLNSVLMHSGSVTPNGFVNKMYHIVVSGNGLLRIYFHCKWGSEEKIAVNFYPRLKCFHPRIYTYKCRLAMFPFVLPSMF